MSILVVEKKLEQLKSLVGKSYDILYTFCIPVIVMTTYFAPQIIKIIAGKGFEGAVVPMRIIMPLMIVIGMEQISIIQLLTPMKKDKLILINSLIGALLGFAFNLILVHRFKSIGSSFTLIISELSVLISAQIMIRKVLGVSFPLSTLITHLLLGVFYFVICLSTEEVFGTNLFTMIMSSLLISVCFFIIHLWIYKNGNVISLVNSILGKAILFSIRVRIII